MRDLIIPKLNANDDSYIFVQWLVPEASWVGRDEAVAVIETSKTSADLMAEDEGYLFRHIADGATCRPGQLVGRLGASLAEARADQEPEPGTAAEDDRQGSGDNGLVVTRLARELIVEHSIPWTAVTALGKHLVRESDVTALIEAGKGAADSSPAAPPARPSLGAHQRAVARRVSESHATIPAAFTVIKVSADGLLRRKALIGERSRVFVGLPELVIEAVAGLRAAHPHCFARVGDDLQLELAPRSDIGVTIDVGTGLYVPVVRDAERLAVPEISARMMDYRVRAMRRTLTEEDIADGRLTLSLHTEPGIVLAQPIIFPGQCCAISVCEPQLQAHVALDGTVVAESCLYLGLAYDHRIINGREATAFLAAAKAELETPEPPGSQL